MLEIDNFRDHRALGLEDADVLSMYRTMLLARKVDERLWALNRQGRVPFIVSAAGHEGVQVGAGYAFDPSRDWSLPYYRDMAYNLTIGTSPEDIFLSVLAKATDPASGGRQMPGHWSEPNLNVFTAGSVIATQFPHACGIAYRLKDSGSDSVVFVSSGEGATSEGDFHEAMNFAAIHELPIVFVIENNLYAISVPIEQEVAGTVAGKAEGYGLPGISIDGNNALEVYGTVSAAIDRARAGKGATLIEARTYRYFAHTSDDDDKVYRSEEEVLMWRRNDPIIVLHQYLVESRLLDESTEASLERELTEEVAEALKRAEAAPEPMDAVSHVFRKPIVPGPAVTTATQVPEGETINMITAINRTLHQILETHDDAYVFGEDVADPKGGVFKATVGLTDTFGSNRSFNAPLAESLIVGVGIGMAAAGAKAMPEIQFADFIHPAFDQIVSEAARVSYRSNGRWNCPVTIRVPYGGGIHGSLYHSQSIEAFYSHVPGLKVVVPSTPADAHGLLWTAALDPDPVMVLEPKKLYRLAKGPVPDVPTPIPFGQAAVRREGDDVTVIAYGTMAHFATEAADILLDEGIEVHVVDLRSLVPLDWPTIEAAIHRNGKVLIVHEDNEFGGFGAEIAAQIASRAFEWLDAPVERYATPSVPTFPFAQSLESQVMPSKQGIVDRARTLAQW